MASLDSIEPWRSSHQEAALANHSTRERTARVVAQGNAHHIPTTVLVPSWSTTMEGYALQTARVFQRRTASTPTRLR
jgi:hypothetical protein